MKKLWSLVLFVIIFCAILAGCSKDTSAKDDDKDDAGKEYQVFEADVIESKISLLVAPDKDSTEFSSSDKISVHLARAKELPETIKAGDRIKIYYDGVIAESYPAQIYADKIEIIGHNQVIDGFFALIDDIYREDTGLNDNITMIAFDFGNSDVLSKTEIETILALAKEEYGLEIIQGTFDELAEQGLIDKENLYFESGVLIEIKDAKTDNGKNKITCSISKWRSGLGAIGWNAEAEFDNGKWNITREDFWIS